MIKLIKKNQYIYYLSSLSLILSITAIVFFIAQGKRINFNSDSQTSQIEIQGTGIINIKSYPDGGKILLDGEPKGSTNQSIGGLKEKNYKLDIVKEGFVTWSKEVPIFNGLVTPIDALLISKTPKIEPLTNVGITTPSISNTGTKITFGVKDSDKPGIYIITLSNTTPLNIFKTNAELLLLDTSLVKYSNTKKITWAPDDSEILVELNNNQVFIVPIGITATTPLAIRTSEELQAIKDEWNKEQTDKLTKFVERRAKTINISEEIQALMIDPANSRNWSPDGDKFMYKIDDTENNQIKYRVYNLEQPLIIGGERDYVTFKLDKDKPQPSNITWYIDSQHIIVLYGNFEGDNPSGTIYLIHMDGSNFTEIYSGQMTSPITYPIPSGDKILVTAKFRQDNPDELYAISLR